MNVVSDRLAGGFFGRLKQGADIDIETYAGKGGADDFRAVAAAA